MFLLTVLSYVKCYSEYLPHENNIELKHQSPYNSLTVLSAKTIPDTATELANPHYYCADGISVLLRDCTSRRVRITPLLDSVNSVLMTDLIASFCLTTS